MRGRARGEIRRERKRGARLAQSFNEEEWTLRTSLEWWRSGGPSRDRGVQPAAAPPPSSHKRCTPPSRRGKPAAARDRGLMGERGGGVSVVACEYVLTSTPASAAMVGSRSRCEVAHAVEAPTRGGSEKVLRGRFLLAAELRDCDVMRRARRRGRRASGAGRGRGVRPRGWCAYRSLIIGRVQQ